MNTEPMTPRLPLVDQSLNHPPTPFEQERLAALDRYGILDTPEEEPFDRLASLARDLFGTPIALVSFVDESRQWFKARVGLKVQQTPRDWAFCTHAMAAEEHGAFVVPDAIADPRFASNPLVIGEPHIRFYAAVPVRTPEGFALGTVCVISNEPRPNGISKSEARWLTTLASLASDELELRLQARRARAAAAAEARLRRAQEAAGVSAFEVSFATADPKASLIAELRRLLGLSALEPICLGGLTATAVNEDWPRLEALASRLATNGGRLAAEFRVSLAGGAMLWVQVHGEVELAVPENPSVWRVAGLLRDVTERRAAEDRQALMTRELDHRAKNALAVVLAALRLTPSSDPQAYVQAVEGRVAALARAHTLLAEGRWTGADLGDLVRSELRPFLCPGESADGPRAQINGPAVLLAAPAAQPLSMALHELATNAVKYGGLSAVTGRLSVTWALESGAKTVRRSWVETGGPAVSGPPQRTGFGSRVIRGTILGQLGGRIELQWLRAGLICEFLLPTDRLLAGASDRDAFLQASAGQPTQSICVGLGGSTPAR